MSDLLRDAMSKIALPELHALLTITLGWSAWVIVDNRVQGPCPAPQPGAKCKGDRLAGFAYPRSDGGPPWLYCHHRNTCGYGASLFGVLADHLGSKSKAAEAFIRAGRVFPRAEFPTRNPLVVSPWGAL